MFRWLSFLFPSPVKQTDALLIGQYATLRKQIPLMYALMFINVCFLGSATFHDVSLGMSIGMPASLLIAIAVRTGIWLRRRRGIVRPEAIRRYLKGTIFTAGLLSLIFGGWGLILFNQADPIRHISIALYIFVGSITCCYCLQSLPTAGRLVLLFGAMPVTIQMLFSDDWYLRGVGANFIFVALLILRTLATSYAGFSEVLSSRSDMLVEQQRARSAEQRAHELAYLDPLTGLPNRRALAERLDSIAAQPDESAALGLLIIDLDMFKSVNDVHGHPAGDRLLQEVAKRLSEVVRFGGSAYRLGGDEFAVTVDLPDGNHDPARGMAHRIVQELAAPFPSEGLVHHIGASVGISLFPRDAGDRETLMRRADIALYKAKELGRSQHRAFEPEMDAEITRRAVLERELRSDLQLADAFRPHYQPIVNVASGRVVGFEMLARWDRSDGADIGPNQFIPVAEESGLIGELMLKLLERVCIDAAAWDPAITVAVNVSPVQLKDPWFSEKILAVLTRTGFPARRIALEITENALIVEPANAKRTVQSLKNQGMLVALDDFGTGYSSIQHLRMLPFDKIKIDRSFVQDLDHNRESRKLVLAMIQLAKSLELGVIAEGVETASVLELLRELGCAEAQGFLFGRPMSAAQAGAMLTAQTELVAATGRGGDDLIPSWRERSSVH